MKNKLIFAVLSVCLLWGVNVSSQPFKTYTCVKCVLTYQCTLWGVICWFEPDCYDIPCPLESDTI